MRYVYLTERIIRLNQIFKNYAIYEQVELYRRDIVILAGNNVLELLR